ncbi:hypothetical protein Efla_003739 [Eimeria flavescens]
MITCLLPGGRGRLFPLHDPPPSTTRRTIVRGVNTDWQPRAASHPMATFAPAFSQLRLLLVAERASAATPSDQQSSSRRWPLLRPLSLPYPSCPEAIVDFFVDGQTVYEINKSCRSMGTCSALLPPELVLSDGSLLLATPVDPLLLLLPQLRQLASTSFVPLLDAVAPPKLSLCVRQNLSALARQPAVLRRLHCLCDLRQLPAEAVRDCAACSSDSSESAVPNGGGEAWVPQAVSVQEGQLRAAALAGGDLFVRYNQEKALSFLILKHSTAAEIAAQRASSKQRDSASKGDSSAHAPATPDRNAQALAFSLLSAYLPKPVAAALEKRLCTQGRLLEEKAAAATQVSNGKTTSSSTSTSSSSSESAANSKNAPAEKVSGGSKRTAAASSTVPRKAAAKRKR